MTNISKQNQVLQCVQTDVRRGILNVSLEDISKDTRSLTRIANIVLKSKFTSNDLVFNFIIETENKSISNDTFITITHKKRNHFNFNWKIYLQENDFCGLVLKHLSYVNYTFVNNKDLVGKFIKSKKWINQEHVDYKLREVNRQLKTINSRKRLLETYCF